MTSFKLTLCELEDTGNQEVESFSPTCVKVHRALALAGFSYERGKSAPEAFRGGNPATDVPVLIVDGRPVPDSSEVVSLLDVMSGGALTNGLDRAARAEAKLWEEMADTVLNAFVVAARWLDEDNWPRTRAAYFTTMSPPARAIVPSRLRSRVRERLEMNGGGRARDDLRDSRFVMTLDELEARAPERGFWLGDAPSRADVAIFAQLWSLRTSLTPRQAGQIAARPRLSAWLERVHAACDRAPVQVTHVATRAPVRISASYAFA
ncbi:MAG TPA: glutathione S-transferase family protein [Polyangiaceae bacterium]|jgi:glutathione S-transferase|nr:glutathione S-transferase family protein [Polyangiaceae bacterium]